MYLLIQEEEVLQPTAKWRKRKRKGERWRKRKRKRKRKGERWRKSIVEATLITQPALRRRKFSGYGVYINERIGAAVENYRLPTATVVYTPSTIFRSSIVTIDIGFKPHGLK
ncbi:conserved hypothetical protein [Ricinus communis]|uniref:Uncharacterized protein n=1 Tax=Ricinus communis TaxID=3988 RepID=B9S887_RICCO|nr:conserved hypothetical protein [Ricinus communis]